MNAREYNQLVDIYADNVYRFALKHLKNEMDAKDVVQSTYLKMWDKHETVALEKGKSYLFTTAYHLILDFLKSGKRFHGEEEIIEVSTNDNPYDFDLSETLQWALDKLPEIQKTVVLFRDYEGYSYDEIAEIAGITESQVKVYIFRARQTLKSILIRKELVI
jgi:RNA polymerase sigma-70 factor (ECF subfamily)